AAGAIGDLVSIDGVHGFAGPAAQAGTLADQQSGFQLFVPRTTTGGGQNQSSVFAPVVTLYTGPMTVTAQLPEANMSGVRVGQRARLGIRAINKTVPGTVSQIQLAPARVPNAIYYDVVISMDADQSQIMHGMTVTVTFG